MTQEQLLIKQIKVWAGDSYIGDDCARLPGGVLVSADSLVEGTHFIVGRTTSFSDLGWKAAAVNLSDIAACAGRPRHMLVSLTLPAQFQTASFRTLYQSLLECCETFRVRVVGGDLTHGPLLVIAITVLGEVHENGCLMRKQARPGDVVVVTGDFGASAAGLWMLTDGLHRTDQEQGRSMTEFAYTIARHRRPQPRVHEAWELVARTGNRAALMDSSDGLADALSQIAKQSGVGMEIDISRVPVHTQTRAAAARAGIELRDWVLYGGEDYELVACLSESVWSSWPEGERRSFQQIGRVTQKGSVLLTDGQEDVSLDLSKCYQHFGSGNGIATSNI